MSEKVWFLTVGCMFGFGVALGYWLGFSVWARRYARLVRVRQEMMGENQKEQ